MMKNKRAEREITPPSRLAIGALISVFLISAVWGTVIFTVHFPEMLTALDVDNYRPARFVVDEVVYWSRKGGDVYYAKGRIDGQFEEEFGLTGVAPVMRTREALEKHFGQQPVSFAVMYNPDRTRTRSLVNGGDSVRVRPAHDRFVETNRKTAWWAAFNVLISIIVAVTAGIFLNRMDENSNKR